MKKFIEALTLLLPFMKDPDDEYVFGGEHDVIIIWTIEWDRVPYETMKKLYSEYSIIPGNPYDRLYDFFGDDLEDWDNITEEKVEYHPKGLLRRNSTYILLIIMTYEEAVKAKSDKKNWCKSHKKCMYSSKSTPKYSIGFTFFGFQSSSMCKDARNGKLVITEEDCYNASILYDEVDKIVNILQTITNVNSKCLYYISVMWYRIKKEYNNKIDNFSTKFIDALDKHKKKVIQKGDDYTKLQTWDRIFRTVKSFVD